MGTELEGQVAVVTGGSRGIGRAIALALAAKGAYVIVNYTSRPDAAEETVKACAALGGLSESMQFDVARAEDVTAAFEAIKSKHERIDILVNNAGISRDGLLIRFKDEDWRQTLSVNLDGAFYCVRAVTKTMMKQRYGRIVNISSVVGEMGNAGQVAYVSSKSGLIGLTKSVARELASRNVTVNAVTPGFVTTDMTEALDPTVKEEHLKAVPLGRFGEPAEVAALVAFLCSKEAGYITGQAIGVNGGMYM